MNDQSPASSAPQVLVVDPKVAYIISQVESSGFSGALRFEPIIYVTTSKLETGPEAELLQKIAECNHCTLVTARMLYSTSYGLYQIMGHQLYRLGFYRPVSEFLAGPHARIFQDTFFAKYLASHGILFTWSEMAADSNKLDLFARYYNGSTAYADRMKEIAAAHYGDTL